MWVVSAELAVVYDTFWYSNIVLFFRCSRFSGSVRVSSVHLRASSVLHLIVQSDQGLLGHGRADRQKTVTVPAVERLGGSRDGESVQDIDVDLRDVPRCFDAQLQCGLHTHLERDAQ